VYGDVDGPAGGVVGGVGGDGGGSAIVGDVGGVGGVEGGDTGGVGGGKKKGPSGKLWEDIQVLVRRTVECMAPTLAAEGGVGGGVHGGVDGGKMRGVTDAGGGAESRVMGCAEAVCETVCETVGETACSWTTASVVALDSPITDRELAACVMACRASCSAIAAKYEEEELCWSSLYMVFIYGLYIGLYGLLNCTVKDVLCGPSQ
jgi:hypothetical protein